MSSSAYIQKAVKKLPYTIKPIGDIALYRKQQEEFEAAWDRSYSESQQHKRKAAISAVESQNAKLELDEVARAEMEHRRARAGLAAWQPASHPAPFFGLDRSVKTSFDQPRPSKGLYDRFKAIWSNMWTNAFRSER